MANSIASFLNGNTLMNQYISNITQKLCGTYVKAFRVPFNYL